MKCPECGKVLLFGSHGYVCECGFDSYNSERYHIETCERCESLAYLPGGKYCPDCISILNNDHSFKVGNWAVNDRREYEVGKITRVLKKINKIDVLIFCLPFGIEHPPYKPKGYGIRWSMDKAEVIPKPEISGDEDYRAPKPEPKKKIDCPYCSGWHYEDSSGLAFCKAHATMVEGIDHLMGLGDIEPRPEGSRKPFQYRSYHMPWQWIRDRVLSDRDNGKCRWCGSEGDEVHHIIPKRCGGGDHPHNLVTLCRNCHTKTLGNRYELRLEHADDGVLPGCPEFYEYDFDSLRSGISEERGRISEEKEREKFEERKREMDDYWRSLGVDL